MPRRKRSLGPVKKVRSLFDLSQVPPIARQEVAGESNALLWDILARLELPDLEEIPDATAVMEGDDKAKRPADWQIPGCALPNTRSC